MFVWLVLLSSFGIATSAGAQSNYILPTGTWERRSPEQSKIDPIKLKQAIDFAIASEAKAPRS
jgi:hypothetical protein